MTDHSALIERLEAHDGSHDRGCDGRNYACTCGDDDKGEALLKEAAAALRDLTEWRDIATAPKDGTQVVMICTDPDVQGFGTRETPHVVIGNWQHPRPNRDPSDGAWNIPMCDWWIGEHDGVLTHWLPLPSAPNQAKAAGE